MIFESYQSHFNLGINKDSGYYVFSPHADLHLTAANLAILHTENYFDMLRTSIGDTEFANFLNLKNYSVAYATYDEYLRHCHASFIFSSSLLILICLLLILILHNGLFH